MKAVSKKNKGAKDRVGANSNRALTGLRATKQRALILDIIRRGKGHLDADEVYQQAREKLPRLSLSTVYRTLQRFKKLGLIQELHFNEEHHHYEMKPAAEQHHLSCLGCGKIIEFNYPLSRYINRRIPEAKGFEITETEVRMAGYCAECRRKKRR